MHSFDDPLRKNHGASSFMTETCKEKLHSQNDRKSSIILSTYSITRFQKINIALCVPRDHAMQQMRQHVESWIARWIAARMECFYRTELRVHNRFGGMAGSAVYDGGIRDT